MERTTEGVLMTEARLQRRRLLRVLGLGFGIAVIIGNTIGAGILSAPGVVAERLPNVWLYLGVWIAGGLYALLGAVSLAELATAIPRSAGQYVFAHRALGPYAGFIVGWSDWLSTCGSIATVALLIGKYAGALFPALAGRVVAVALFVTLTFTILQWRGLRWGSRTQNLTSMLKAVAFMAIVAACFILGGDGLRDSQAVVKSPQGLSLLAAIVISLQAVIYTYDGWNGVVYFSEEIRDPVRDVPRSLFLGVLSIIAIYLLVNFALIYVLPLGAIAGKELAIADAAQKIFGRYGETYGYTIISALAIISMLSAINAYHLMASRVLFSMSCDRFFSSRAEKVNEGGTPTIALFVGACVAALFILSGNFEMVVGVLAFFFVANYTISFISVFVLRRREPELKRPYKAWGYPWTTALALLGSIAFLCGAVASDTQTSLYALLLLAASYPAFLLFRRLSV